METYEIVAKALHYSAPNEPHFTCDTIEYERFEAAELQHYDDCRAVLDALRESGIVVDTNNFSRILRGTSE